MNMYLVIYLCLIFKIAVTAKYLRIFGGEDADIREFPYIASLRLYKKLELICGGVIISNRHILTAAHCFDEFYKSDIRIYIGTDNSSDYDRPFYKIRNVKMHRDFNKNYEMEVKALKDIAILTIEPCIEFNEFQQKIDLAVEDVYAGQNAVVTGWGWTDFSTRQLSNMLQKATMKIIPNLDCTPNLPFKIYSEQLCAFQKLGVGICFGDSGGPLVSDGKLIGISSFSTPCALGEPDVYMRIYSFLDFIKPIISKDNPLCCLAPWAYRGC